MYLLGKKQFMAKEWFLRALRLRLHICLKIESEKVLCLTVHIAVGYRANFDLGFNYNL